MTQEFVTLPREVVEHVLKALGCGGLLKQRQAMAALHAALEQLQGEQEPVAEHELKDVRCECCGYMTHHREHMGCIRAAQPKRLPLTDEQILRIVQSAQVGTHGKGHTIARAIEAAHNIK